MLLKANGGLRRKAQRAVPVSATAWTLRDTGGFAPRPVSAPSSKGRDKEPEAPVSFKLTVVRRIKAGQKAPSASLQI